MRGGLSHNESISVIMTKCLLKRLRKALWRIQVYQVKQIVLLGIIAVNTVEKWVVLLRIKPSQIN